MVADIAGPDVVSAKPNPPLRITNFRQD